MRRMFTEGYGSAGAAMFLVGTLATVSGLVNGYPLFGGQALRYTLSAGVLLLVARWFGLAFLRPTPFEMVLLTALAATGLVLFNIFVVHATRHASPATVGTVIGAVPIVLALAGPTLKGKRPSPKILVAASIVVAGTAITSGLGSSDTGGVLFSVGALGCEACFTLLALPLLTKFGPIRVSAYTAGIAAPMFLVVGAAADGSQLFRTPTFSELAGFLYLAVVVGAGAFLLWYGALPRLGADRAGLFAGMVPIGAIATATALGFGLPKSGELIGAAVVITGLLLGLSPARGYHNPDGSPETRAGVRLPCQARPHPVRWLQGQAAEASGQLPLDELQQSVVCVAPRETDSGECRLVRDAAIVE